MHWVLGYCDNFDKRGGAKAENDATAAIELPELDMFETAE